MHKGQSSCQQSAASKILYYIQKDFLKNNDIAFADDIEAWQFGPVVPNVYYHFCGFGAMPITIIYQDDTYEMKEADIKKFNVIIEAKRILNPWDMVEETHKPDGAWNQIYKNGTGNHCVIPTSLIKEIG